MDEQNKRKLLIIAGRISGLTGLMSRLARAQDCEDVAQTMAEQNMWIVTVRVDNEYPEGVINLINRRGEIATYEHIGHRRISARQLHTTLSESEGITLSEHVLTQERLRNLSDEERLEAIELEGELEKLQSILADAQI